MKTRKILSLMVMALLIGLTMNCTNDEDAITYSVRDVSSRISGFSSDITGAGAPLTVNGTDLDGVTRIFVGDHVVPKKNFTALSESSISFNVPTGVPTGEAEVLLVWPGQERGFTSIEVVPLQLISSMHPLSGNAGEVITLHGDNFMIVDRVEIAGVEATVSEKTDELLSFTLPSGISSGPVTLIGVAGAVNSSQDIIACESEPAQVDCMPALNLNSGFEDGEEDNFTNWGQWNGNNFMTETKDPQNVFRGSRAIQVVRDGTLGSGQWKLQLASDQVSTEVGASYSVYVWVKATAPGGAMRVSTSPSALYTADQEVPTTWTRLEFNFTANVENTAVVLDMNGEDTVPATFYIDDVKLLKN